MSTTTKEKASQPQGGSATAPAKPATQALVRLDWHKPTSLDGLKAFAPQVLGQMNAALPRFLAGQGERMIRCLFTCCQKLPALLNCTPLSLFGGVIQAGQMGLELGAPLGQAYLIPFGKEATFVLGYKGAVNLAFRSTLLASIPVNRVREGDHFEVVEGTDRRIVHKPKRNSRGKVTDYYVTATLTNGGRDFETFTFDEAVEFRDRYAATRNAPPAVRDHSPWYDLREGLGWNGFDWMACKTLMKRLGKRLPVSVEFQRAIALDDQAEANLPQELGSAIELDPDPVEERLGRQLQEAKNGTRDPSQEPAPSGGGLYGSGADGRDVIRG